MGKDKLKRFAENETFPNMFHFAWHEPITDHKNKGIWNQFFGNDNPIVLELGCGRGEYTVGLSKRYPDKNFIGIDIKGARMWRGCKTTNEEGFKNAAFVRTKIQLVEYIFEKDEVSEIWITFPDPQPKERKERKRLTSPPFLNHYRKLLKPDGLVHLKTDNTGLYEYTLEVIENQNLPLLEHSADVYSDMGSNEITEIQTFYEAMFAAQGEKIKYVLFKLTS